MKSIIGIFSVLIFLISCCPKNKNETQNTPEIFSTNYGKIDDQNLKLKYGDIVELEINNQKIRALVLDIKNEESEFWFGLCFVQNNQLFGRRIPQGFGGKCVELFDITYLNEKGLNHLKIVDKLKINFNIVGTGSNSPVMNEKEILRDFERGLELRNQKETPCDKKLGTLEPINECYIKLEKIRNDT